MAEGGIDHLADVFDRDGFAIIEQGFRFVTVGLDGGLSAGASRALSIGREAAGRGQD